MTNKENFLKLVSPKTSSTLDDVQWRIKNRAMLRESQEIAMKVLDRLGELKWSQKDLAAKMEVKPQQVNKIVRGKENLTLDTITKLQAILDIPILATYYEDRLVHLEKTIHPQITVIVKREPYEGSRFAKTIHSRNTNIISVNKFHTTLNAQNYSKRVYNGKSKQYNKF